MPLEKSIAAKLILAAIALPIFATNSPAQIGGHSFEKWGYTDAAFQRPDGNIWVAYRESQDSHDVINKFDVPILFTTAVVRSDGSRLLSSDRFLGYGNRFTFFFFFGAVQPDNKLLLVSEAAGFIRLNADGSLDKTFNPQASSSLPEIALQSNGRIITVADGAATRLNSDGSQDPSFVSQLNSTYLHALALQSSGKIVVATDSAPYLKRLNSDGSVDQTFAANLNSRIDRTLVLPDDAILTETFQNNSNGSVTLQFQRLNADGSLDPAFHPDARLYQWLAAQPDGKVFAGFRDTATGDKFFGRMNRDGSLDSSFQNYTAGPRPTFLSSDLEPFSAAFVQQDGSVVLDVVSSSGAQQFLRFAANGVLHPPSERPFTISASVTSLVAQQDGKLLVSGDFNYTDGLTTGPLIRLLGDGSTDGSFHPPALTPPTTGARLGVQKSGAMLFTATGATVSNIPMRLAPDGSVDSSFAAQNLGRVFKIMDDDRILSWDYTSVRRLLSDGTVDASFATTKIDFGGFSGNNVVEGLIPQADGKILVFGNAVLFNGIHSMSVRAAILRLNANGGVDSSFTPPTFAPNTRFNCAALQPDGKIVLGGRLDGSSVPTRLNPIRLNGDGSLDSTFNVVANYTVSALLIEGSGSILMGGGFSSVNGSAAPGVARIQPNGQVDPNFYFDTGGAVYALLKLADGRIVAGGDFGLTASPSSRLRNISTRMRVDAGDNALIGGIIVTGDGTKKILIRGIGPSLAASGVNGALQDPYLELHNTNGAVIASNDDWQKSADAQAIADTTIPPTDSREAAILTTISAGGSAYTAVMRPANGSGGIGLVEVYDLDGDSSRSKLANISTRGNVLTGDNVMISGFIVVGPANAAPTTILARALGPSVPLSGVLQDPMLELHQSSATLATNDDWKQTRRIEIENTGIPPKDDRESAIAMTLSSAAPGFSGNYTTIIRGKNNSAGIALLEVYDLSR